MASSTHSSITKRESIPTAGSVFFISSAGRVLKLPIPSGSYRDPLTWSWSKRFLAFFALQSLSIAVSFELNLPGLLIEAIRHEFKDEVWLTSIEIKVVLIRNQDLSPFSIESFSSAITLFTGFGYLISIPLSTAVGRRPVFVSAAITATLSTLWAGFGGSFYQLLAAASFQGLAAGSATGMVCDISQRAISC